MRNSDKLQQEAQQEENDLAYLGKMNQVLREKRVEKWEDWKDKIIESPNVDSWDENLLQGKITFFVSNDKLGSIIVDYYPKANKVLIRKSNKWIKPGLRWLINNLIVKTNEKI